MTLQQVGTGLRQGDNLGGMGEAGEPKRDERGFTSGGHSSAGATEAMKRGGPGR